MPTTTIRAPPAPADFTPLPEYQTQTPDTFFDGKPVLHSRVEGARCWIPRAQRGSLPVFPADCASAPSGPEGAVASSAEELVEQRLDVWVNSANLTLFNPEAQVGVTIPYPSISIHALKTIGQGTTQAHGVWMQLDLGEAEDEDATTELTLIPPPPADEDPQAAARHLFEAVSACSNLHPDPTQEDSEDEDRVVFEGGEVEGLSGVVHGVSDGGLPPPMPGSSGWITAENVHEYFDGEGNWIGGGNGEGELGDGAGRVRGREEAEEVNGRDGEDADSKRPRME